MNKINIKNEFSEVDLIERTNNIKKTVEETTEKIEFLKNKMLIYQCFLAHKINITYDIP